MNHSEFLARFQQASEATLRMTREQVIEPLNAPLRFLVEIAPAAPNPGRAPGASGWAEPSGLPCEPFPRDAFDPDGRAGPFTLEEAADLLWRDGRVPLWIEMSIDSAGAAFTGVLMKISGFMAADETAFQVPPNGHRPFRCAGPPIPPYAMDENYAAVRKFHLRWRDTYRLPLGARLFQAASRPMMAMSRVLEVLGVPGRGPLIRRALEGLAFLTNFFPGPKTPKD